MRASKLLLEITVYYLVIGFAIYLSLRIWPELRNYLPIGGVEQLISQPSKNPLEASQAVRAAHVGNFGQSVFWLVVAIIAAILVSLPVSWTYMAVRGGEEYDQSLVNTIIVLPMVVTGIVIIVQNSLALAFSLAGIAGAVRFRNSLKSSGDALFILLAVGIGLSAGIGAIELAAVISIFFNYTFAILWFTEYGERAEMKRFLADYRVSETVVVVEEEKKEAT
ncbi:MAG TPA: hypothetical protein VHE36_01500 [Sphingomicrobium sp.]|nr:hypothetical protein [Sphingomicrobium sp.]